MDPNDQAWTIGEWRQDHLLGRHLPPLFAHQGAWDHRPLLPSWIFEGWCPENPPRAEDDFRRSDQPLCIAMCSWVTPTAILAWAPSAQRKLLQPFAVASLQQRSTWSLFAEASGVTESVCLTLCPWRCTASAAQCEHAWSQPRVDPELSALLWWRRWWPSLALVTASLAPAATPEPQPILQRLPSKHWRLPTDIWLQTFGSPPPMWSLLSRSGLTTLHSRSRLLATTESLRMRGQLGVVEKDCALNCSFFLHSIAVCRW